MRWEVPNRFTTMMARLFGPGPTSTSPTVGSPQGNQLPRAGAGAHTLAPATAFLTLSDNPASIST